MEEARYAVVAAQDAVLDKGPLKPPLPDEVFKNMGADNHEALNRWHAELCEVLHVLNSAPRNSAHNLCSLPSPLPQHRALLPAYISLIAIPIENFDGTLMLYRMSFEFDCERTSVCGKI